MAPARKKICDIVFGKEKITLRFDGSAFMSEYNCLLVSDLHLGKDASFRNSGIPVPRLVTQTTLKEFEELIKETNPQSVIILGDLIHDRNSIDEYLVSAFSRIRQIFANTVFQLVRGNHDRWVRKFPLSWAMEEHQSLDLGGVRLVHDPDQIDHDVPVIAGHRHPVCNLGKGPDRIRLRCFVNNGRQLVLPAFGPFKGGMSQCFDDWPEIYPINQDGIWKVKRK